jgi:4-diphosphocytidyl-2-C-methyl-D-erythritol kinase
MITANLKSFAKINIGLRILSKREDGYHNLETIFYPISLFDEIILQIEKSESTTNSVILKCNKSFIPLNSNNICFKAVEAFFRAFNIKGFYKISIDLKKNIPVGGGLGGGSSNAAAVLKFLIKYFQIDIKLNKAKILDLALSIGSDVPFFLIMRPCYAEGRGEKMKILNSFKTGYDILIVNPNLHISTKWAFQNLNYQEGFAKEKLLHNVITFNPGLKNVFENDFEKIVFSKYSLLGEIKKDLENSGSVFASMSGSGATIYGLFEKNDSASILKCRNNFRDKKYFTFISD